MEFLDKNAKITARATGGNVNIHHVIDDLQAAEEERGELHNRLHHSQLFLLDLFHHGLSAMNKEMLFKIIQANKPFVRSETCPDCGYAVSSVFDHIGLDCSPDMTLRQIRKLEKEGEEIAKQLEAEKKNG